MVSMAVVIAMKGRVPAAAVLAVFTQLQQLNVLVGGLLQTNDIAQQQIPNYNQVLSILHSPSGPNRSPLAEVSSDAGLPGDPALRR